MLKIQLFNNLTTLVRPMTVGLALGLLAACGVNPVTGERELQLVSQEQEVNIGEKQYTPTQQSQGGQLSEFKELNDYVNMVGQKVAKHSHRADLPFEFVVLDNPVPNAWALPGGKIAINWGLLLEMGDEAELAAVLGHEVTHATARHGAKSMERGMALQAGLVGVMIGAGLSDIDRGAQQAILAGAAVGSKLILTKYGRNAELESDKYGIEYMVKAGYDPRAAVRLQETFVRLSEGRQPDFIKGLFASHPPSQERVEKNKLTVAEYINNPPANGWTVNKGIYQKKIAFLHDLKKSQEKLQAANDNLKAEKYAEALKDIDAAKKLTPDFSVPYAMRAVSYLKQDQEDKAKSSINKAIKLRDNYFKFYEIRAEINEEQGDKQAAQNDLKKANGLLPTEGNSLALAQLSLANGDTRTAQTQFSALAGRNTSAGRVANYELAKLTINKQPARYLSVQGQVDQTGRFYITLQNRSPLTLTKLDMLAQLPDGRQVQTRYGKAIKPGKVVSIPTKLVDVTPAQAQNMRLRFNKITSK